MTRKRIAWLPLTFVVDQHGANASNNSLRIVIRRGIKRPGAVLCQERAEWAWKWKRLQIVRFFPALRRSLEFFGHAVEVEVAVRHYGVDRDACERAEARALTSPSYEQFQGFSADAIKAGLEARRGCAARWVDRHPRYVRWAVEHRELAPDHVQKIEASAA